MGPWARKLAAYDCCQLGAMGANQISTTKTAIWITPEASSVEYPVTVSFQNTCIHSLYSIIMFFTFFFVQQKILLSKVGNKTVKSHRRNWHAWMIKVNWWTWAHLHAGLTVGLLDTFFLLSSFFWDEIPSLLVCICTRNYLVLAPVLKMTLFPSVLGLAGPLGPRRWMLGFQAQSGCSVCVRELPICIAWERGDRKSVV